MDQNDRLSPPKSEPSLDPVDAFAVPPSPVALPVASDSMEAGDMPAWLNTPGEEAAPRWKRPMLWLGGVAVAVALGAVGSQWLLQEHQAESTVEINELGAQAEQAAAQARQQDLPTPAAQVPVLPPRGSSPLPPLVLLPPEQGGKAPAAPAPVEGQASNAGTPAPVSTALPATPAVVTAAPEPARKPAAKPVALPQPVIAKSPEKVTPAKPALAAKPAAAKPSPAIKPAPDVKPAPVVRQATVAAKPALAPKPVVKPAAKPAPKKKPLPPKRVATKPAPKKVQGITLPPPRERAAEAREDREERPAAARKCIPGELARECEARLKQR